MKLLTNLYNSIIQNRDKINSGFRRSFSQIKGKRRMPFPPLVYEENGIMFAKPEAVPGMAYRYNNEMYYVAKNRNDLKANISSPAFGEHHPGSYPANRVVTTFVTDMQDLFMNSNFNDDISNWDVSNVTNMSQMFVQTLYFNSDISKWDVSNVTSFYGMFYEAREFNADISNWDVSNVTNMEWMFGVARNFNRDLSGWCVSNIPSIPEGFDDMTLSWVLPKPVWGTCP